MAAIEDMIRKRAYELWERAGCPDGRSYEFWFAAGVELGAAQSPDEQEGSTDAPSQEPPAVAVEPGVINDRIEALMVLPASKPTKERPEARAAAKPKARRIQA